MWVRIHETEEKEMMGGKKFVSLRSKTGRVSRMNVSEYVALAAAAYGRGDAVETRKKIEEQSKGKYSGVDYDIIESDKDYTVFLRKKDNQIILACRGTSGLDDLIPDAFIAAGLLRLHPRARKIIEAVRRYKVLDPGMVVTGHSLGGKLAALCGASEGVLAVTFNQGSSPMDSNYFVTDVQTVLGGFNYKNVIHFTTVLDGVSTTEAIAQNNHTFFIDAPSNYNVLENHFLDAFNDIDDSKYSEFIDTETKRVNSENKRESYTGYAERQYYDARNAQIAYNLHKAEIEKYMGENETVKIEQAISRDGQRESARERWLAMENDLPDSMRIIYRSMSDRSARRVEAENDADQIAGMPLRHPDTTVDVFDGIGKEMTWEETMVRLDRNITNIYGQYPGAVSEEMAAKLRVRIAEFRRLKQMEELLAKIGLGRVMKGVISVYQTSVRAWTAQMSAWALAAPIQYYIASRFVKVLKGFAQTLVWAVQIYFVVTDWTSVVNDVDAVNKLKEMIRDPSMNRYTFWISETLSVLEDRLINDSIYAGVHTAELIGGILITIFAPEVAPFYWGTVAVQQISEIPVDIYIKNETERRFNQKWYNGNGDVWVYLARRDAYEKSLNDTYGGVYQWTQWVMNENVGVTSKWARMMPSKLGGQVVMAADKLKQSVIIILNDNSVVGLGDSRYEKLSTMKDTTSITSWNRSMQGIVNSGNGVFEDNPFMGNSMDMSDYVALGVIGNTYFKNSNMTIQEYTDQAAYLRHRREIFQKLGADDVRYKKMGGKPQGDKESDDEYRDRVNTWVNDQALSSAYLSQSAGSEQYWANTTPSPSPPDESDDTVYISPIDKQTVCKVGPTKRKYISSLATVPDTIVKRASLGVTL